MSDSADIRSEGNIQTLPLFHTTTIGSSSGSDIRVKSRLVSRRHAIIYLFDGVWFIRALTPRSPVYINNTEILHPVPLQNQDRIGIGAYSFLFIDEAASAGEASLTYEDYVEDPEYPKSKAFSKILGGYFSFCLFYLIGFSLLTLFIPSENTKDISLLLIGAGAFFVLFNLYFWLLPLIFPKLDRSIFLILSMLSLIGLLIQIRLAAVGATGEKSIFSGLTTQFISFSIGFILLPLIIFLCARTFILEHLGKVCAVLTPLFLLVTLILGHGAESNGATLWVTIAGFSVQLTEFAKVTYLIVLASFFKNRTTRKDQFIFAIWAAIVFALIMLLPDLGSAMILLPTTLIVYVVMTSEYFTTLIILLSGSAVGALAFTIFPHVRRRILGWSTLWTEVNDNNRQIVYGLQAVGRGGLFGRGLGNGSPGGIPLVNSDMVFSILCEELGLITGLCIVLLFIIVWLRSAKIAVLSHDGYSSGLTLGIGTLLFIEAVIVISGVTGLLPLTGATLPLIAQGGSSVLTILVLFGILLGLSARKEDGGETL